MTVLVGNHDFLTGCKLNGDSVLNAEFCLEYVEISTNGDKSLKLSDLSLDVVIETAGVEQALNMAIEAVKIGGTVLIFGYHQGPGRTINMQMANWKGIDMINTHERSRSLKIAAMKTAIQMLSADKFKMTFY